MEFKGTKGNWKFVGTPEYHEPKCSKIEILSVENTNAWIAKVQDNGIIEEIEGKANALLISKAPEMLAMLNEILKECSLTSGKYVRIEKLIKEATEILWK